MLGPVDRLVGCASLLFLFSSFSSFEASISYGHEEEYATRIMEILAEFTSAQTSPLTSPSPPLWPNSFIRPYAEVVTHPMPKLHATVGALMYDWSNKRMAIIRKNGRFNEFCGQNGNMSDKDTPCVQFVINERRYLVYPLEKECCFCCDASHGCGVPPTTWLQDSSFLRTMTLPLPNGASVSANLWRKSGRQQMLYVEDAATRQMIILYLVPDDLFVYIPKYGATMRHAGDVKAAAGDYDNPEMKEVHDLAQEMMTGGDFPPAWCDLLMPCEKTSMCTKVQGDDKSAMPAPTLHSGFSDPIAVGQIPSVPLDSVSDLNEEDVLLQEM